MNSHAREKGKARPSHCGNAEVQPVGQLELPSLGQGGAEDALLNAGVNVSGEACIVIRRGYVCTQSSVAECVDVTRGWMWYDDPGRYWTEVGRMGMTYGHWQRLLQGECLTVS